jgi:hypothetical protein
MAEEQLEGTFQEASEGIDEAPQTEDVEALQSELIQLQRQVDEHEVAAKARQHRGRGWAVGLLVVFGVILLAVANLTFWVRGTVLNTNRWVAAVGPLTQNEVVANALSFYLVDTVFELVDVEQVLNETLPQEFGFLSGSLTSVLQDQAQQLATSLVQSDQFNAVWVGLNRAAHTFAMRVLRGGDVVSFQGGDLTVDLSDALNFVTNTFDLGNLDAFQDVQTSFVILQSQQVAVAQQVLSLIDSLGLIVPLLALVFLFLAWLISLWRRRTVMWIGIGVAVAMVLSLILFALAQSVVLVNIVDPFIRLLAGEIWDVATRGLYIQTIIVLIVGLLFILGAWLAGPSRRAVGIRTGVSNWWSELRS